MASVDNKADGMAPGENICKRKIGKSSTLPLNWQLSKEQQKQWSRRRMRRLYIADKHSSKRAMRAAAMLKQRRSSHTWYMFAFLSVTLSLICGIIFYNSGSASNGFQQLYSMQYRSIINNNLKYCDRNMPLKNIFVELRLNVLNQDEALKQLQQSLSNNTSFQSIALIGSSGVGKSLTVRIIQEKFPWPENVQYFAWNGGHYNDELGRFLAVQRMLENLAHCGRNLIIIENMAACDLEFVSTINELLLSRRDLTNGTLEPDMKQLTIIYVFNLNRMLYDKHYTQQVEALQELPQTTSIVYKTFGPEELRQCLCYELSLENIELNEKVALELLNSIDANVAGCKPLRAKVLLYGQPIIREN